MAFDVVVVGGGIIGTASAYYLSKQGYKVALLDQGALVNPEASSCDHARVFRLTHGKDSFYTDLARRTIPLWKELSTEVREELFTQYGMIDLVVGDGKLEKQSMSVLDELKIPYKILKGADIAERYRMIKPRTFKWGLYHAEGGFIWAKKAIEHFLKMGLKSGVQVEAGAKVVKILKGKEGIEGLKDSSGRTWKGKQYLFAAGAWTKEILKDYGLPLTVTRQEALYLRPPQNQGRYRPQHFPVMSVTQRGFHMMPVHIHGFLKVGMHKQGSKVTNVVPPSPDAKFVNKVRSFLKAHIADLAGFQDLEGKVYYYTRTPDGDFILDKLPGQANAWLAAGFGGMGPMLAPLIGTTITQLMSGDKPDFNLHRFRIGRLKLRK